jgi:hypothetical protein
LPDLLAEHRRKIVGADVHFFGTRSSDIDSSG